jgi:hypothetical protein
MQAALNCAWHSSECATALIKSPLLQQPYCVSGMHMVQLQVVPASSKASALLHSDLHERMLRLRCTSSK